MKIAYLIQAHNNYLHLERLIQALQMKGASFFVHIDKKSPLPDVSVFPSNVFFIRKRVRVYWAAFSQVQATLNLIDAAVERDVFDYYAYISGSDYPVQPGSFLINRLSEGKEYINLHDGFQSHKPRSRLENFHFQRIDRKNYKKWNSIGFILVERALNILGYKRKIPDGVGSGSSWFILSNACIRFITGFLKQDPFFVNHFKKALCPDEYFFQTIVNRSPFAGNVVGHLTYTDWNEGSNSPAMINRDHLEYFKRLKEQGKLTYFFARKFDDRDKELIDWIDSELR